MKKISMAVLIVLLSMPLANSETVTNINAVYRSGQLFLTWDNISAGTFLVYKSPSPILHGSNLPFAQYLGRIGYSSAYNPSAGRYLRIDSAAEPLASTKGLFVGTSTASGSYYYAVTSVTDVEDTSIVVGSNALASPVSEAVADPKPVWQFDSLCASKHFNSYAWFATGVTSANFPLMTNLGMQPLNFAVVKQGAQTPHPVMFWLRPSGRNYIWEYVYGIGDPNEWIVSIDDYNPNNYDAHMTNYYGYHQNYDLLTLGVNTIPTSGTIYNYTNEMVNHTVNWALRNLPLDSARAYMTGFSLGAVGTVLYSFMEPSKIAAIFLYAPEFDLSSDPWIGFDRLYGTYETNLPTNEGMLRNERLNGHFLISKNKLNSLPIMYSYCGKNDANVGWTEKISFYDSLNILKHGGFSFWSMGAHPEIFFNNPWQIASYPPKISFFTRFRTNLSYPAFSDCSVNHDPGNGTSSSGDSIGTINGCLDWNDNIIDSTHKWQITLKTRELVNVYDTLDAPDSCTSSVTLRRLQMFSVPTGRTISWINTRNEVTVQQGSFLYDGGLITVPNVRIYSTANTLTVTYNTVGIEENNGENPIVYLLSQNYPNPFNPTTKITYKIQSAGFTRLVVYDIMGREVATLVNEKQSAGTYQVEFDGSGLSSGVYYFRLNAGNYISVKKMVLLK
jgi:hypothetical protein